MAASAGDIADEELDREEISIALSLSEALQADEVETFLVLYDSIPSSIATERVNTIKEMARQLAALPKKQFELHRSKKVLSRDHSLLSYGGSWNFKGKLGTEFIRDSAFLETSCGPTKKCTILQSSLPTPAITLLQLLPESPSSTPTKKKNSSDLGQTLSSSDETVYLTTSKMEENNLDLPGGKQLSVPMNKDISTNCEDVIVEAVRENKESDALLQHKKMEQIPSEGCKTDYLKDPPFGFPPSPEKIFVSALGLLPTSSVNSNDVALMENNHSKRTCEGLKTTDQKAHLETECEETSPSDPNEERANGENCDQPIFGDDANKSEVESHIYLHLETETRQELCESLTSPPGDFMTEAKGWQSQTKRPYRKKKRELAARAGREKFQMEKNQRKWEHRQNFVHTKKNIYHKKIQENQKPFAYQEVEKNQSHYPGNASNITAQEEQASASKYEDVSSQKINEGSSSNITAAEADSPSKKTFSYRDALLKKENQYSSDSGIDANSVSSCESVPHPESPKQAPFNHEEVANYLRKGWQGVLDGAKKGLVSFYREGAYPVTHKWQKTKRQPNNVEMSQSKKPPGKMIRQKVRSL